MGRFNSVVFNFILTLVQYKTFFPGNQKSIKNKGEKEISIGSKPKSSLIIYSSQYFLVLLYSYPKIIELFIAWNNKSLRA